ncbi:hypothetical protein GCM10007939_01160 [Amylibacter marinus]|uniref:Uncharacterized protein n=1 Tax=Amylibacter marinus TaxID=1475483 RepID=A0ABQ5VQZ4_9RHOB|nr:hypothetical protein [Amylibacter marinus]GLQ33833.1 hypothetical protein GCM10007939_01160 [Amylibacter marinus]
MFSKVLDRIFSLPVWAHLAGLVASIAWFKTAKTHLDKSYTASQHPVDFFTGQTTFNSETIKGYYAVMQDAGTLGIYVRTQILDYAFILGLLLMGLFFATGIARAARAGSWGRSIGRWAATSIALGALCDAIENAWSFVMLANPHDFASWLALPYSGFAAAKFALLTLGMALLCVTIASVVLGRIMGREAIG